MSLLLLHLAALGSVALGEVIRIRDASSLVNFAKNVKLTKDYFGSTVLLDSDIEFTEELSQEYHPIEFFHGTFDGQGHAIKNLALNISSSRRVGLFAYSDGKPKIKNIVIDDSCTIASNYKYGNTYVGSIVGEYYTNRGTNSIENNVNMASVTFNKRTKGRGSGTNGNLYIGGIIGCVSPLAYVSTIQNCANYGSVVNYGESKLAAIGGIVGYVSIYSTSKTVHIENCLNYGSIAHNGNALEEQHLGGIVGSGSVGDIESCVNYGRITTSEQKGKTYIGGIVGYAGSSVLRLSFCYWNGVGQMDSHGFSHGQLMLIPTDSAAFDESTLELTGSVSVGKYTGKSLIEVLNAYSDTHGKSGYSRWILNNDGNNVTFSIDGSQGFSLATRIILLPNLPNEEIFLFDGWYADGEYGAKFTGHEIYMDTELSGTWKEDTDNYTITFDTNGGRSVAPISTRSYSVVPLPNPEKDGCVFASWKNESGNDVEQNFTMPARNVTLSALWLCTHITNAAEFATFVSFAGRGTDFKGTTIYLETDLDLSGVFSQQSEPIDYFIGTFDGQGHVFRNFMLNSSQQHTGVLGFSRVMTIKNIVLDESCTIENSYDDGSTNDIYMGAIIGMCYAQNGPCVVSGCVNMANFSFSGNNGGGILYLGGIAGYVQASGFYDSTVSNSVNYGSFSNSGRFGKVCIGGIVGRALGSYYAGTTVHVRNCTNYGGAYRSWGGDDIINKTIIGGIIGIYKHTIIENCTNNGFIISGGPNGLRPGSVGGCNAVVVFVLLLLFFFFSSSNF